MGLHHIKKKQTVRGTFDGNSRFWMNCPLCKFARCNNKAFARSIDHLSSLLCAVSGLKLEVLEILSLYFIRSSVWASGKMFNSFLSN